MAGIRWHISTRSPDNGGQCVEAGPWPTVAVRQTALPCGRSCGRPRKTRSPT
ncbi:DUF397 domain-containing protein [Glycomyces sp. L485]|uniref:DUF397 domain-containing protein n=1 Tax=Glycomyces sp. L485 TaxID=2909235 RepID=UPI00321C0C86